MKILKNKLVIYIIFFFLFIFINSLIHFINFDLLLKTLGNFRYLFLSFAVFFVFEKTSGKQRKFFVYFNVVIILFITLDILYQFVFYKDIFGFAPGMCNDKSPIKCVRFSGVFGDELIAGSYLSQIGLLILMLFFNLDLNKNNLNFFIKIILFFFFFINNFINWRKNCIIDYCYISFFYFFF